MRRNLRKLFFAFHALVLFSACFAAQPYDRYQSIIDRKPFGPEPVNFDPEAAPDSAAANVAAEGEMTEEQRTVEEQQLAASVRVSMINVTPAGAVAVGFTDSSAQPPENYYLIVGCSRNGWTVKSADPATESVTLDKKGIEVTVKLGESSGGGNAKGGKGRRLNPPMTLQKRPEMAAEAPGADGGTSASAAPTHLGGLARLRQRRAAQRAEELAAAEKRKAAAAAAAAELEERKAREEEEKRAMEERELQRDAIIRQLQEQFRKEKEARDTAKQESEQVQEE